MSDERQAGGSPFSPYKRNGDTFEVDGATYGSSSHPTTPGTPGSSRLSPSRISAST